jgi:hypothetical protein
MDQSPFSSKRRSIKKKDVLVLEVNTYSYTVMVPHGMAGCQQQASASALPIALLATYFHAGILLGLFFDPEDGSDMFLLNLGGLSADYRASYPRR